MFLLSFWLFYGVRLVEQRRKIQYADIVKYATSLLDSLIGLYYFSCLLLELCHSGQSQFLMKVVRNPDGESQSFPIGKLSIQRAAAHELEMYYTQFPIYNPFLEQIHAENRGIDNYKYYDVDGMGNLDEKVRPHSNDVIRKALYLSLICLVCNCLKVSCPTPASHGANDVPIRKQQLIFC